MEFIWSSSRSKLLQIGLSTFDESSQTFPKTQKRKFVKLLQYIKQKYCNCFCVLLWCKTLRYFTGFQSCLLLLVFGRVCSKMRRAFGSWNSEIWISKEWIDEMSWFFICLCKFRKANVNLIIIGWAWSKMDKTFRSYGTLKTGVSHNMIWLIKQIDLIIFGLTTNLLRIFDICLVSTAVALAKNDVLVLVPAGK